MSHTKRALLKLFNLLYMALIWKPKINLEIRSINGFKTTSRGKKHAFTNRFEIQFGALGKKINQFVCLDLSSKQIDSSLPCFCNCVLAHTHTQTATCKFAEAILFCFFVFLVKFKWFIKMKTMLSPHIELNVSWWNKKKIYDQTQRPITDYDTVCNGWFD